MKKYIGFKMLEAELQLKNNQDGYKVIYPDGYESWSPKEVFEKSYMEVGYDNTIKQENVDRFISKIEFIKLGEKTTVVKATLSNGFIIVDSSSCVDAENFDMSIGTDICVDRIKNKIWELLGFLLQTAKFGVTNK